MRLSIVTTLYKSASYLPEFYSRMTETVKKVVGDDGYELIFVDDGSPDNSLQIVKDFFYTDKHVKIIELSRNFGHHKAIMTGLSHAMGDLVFLLDCDLEEDPEWLIDFEREIINTGVDVIFGVQENRKGGLFEQFTGSLFWSLFNKLSGLGIEKNMVTTRLMSQHYVLSLLQHQEREVFLAGLMQITGYEQKFIIVKKHSNGNKSTYTLRKKLSLFINSVTSFSNTPLLFVFYTGIVISGVSSFFAISLILRKIFFSVTLSGWTSLMISIWLLGGLIISFIGIIGIYLSKIFSEVKQRPYTIIKKIYENKNNGG